MVSGTDLSFAVAVRAGLLSFLSPCVLPLVPAYLGQLTAVAVAANPAGGRPSRWLALRHAAAYVAGFGLVFTLLGVTATFAAGPLVDYLPLLRQIGGVVLIILGALDDRAPAILRPLVAHGRLVSVVGGLLVVAIGVAMVMDWLALLPRYFQFNTSI